MRRLIAALALGGAATLMLAACGNPAGVDGDLADDWSTAGKPQPFTPSAPVCHESDYAETAYLSSYAPVDCTAAHRLETIHVGMFTGTAAGLQTPPGKNSAEIRTAFTECDTKTTEYVGSDWRNGRLRLGVALPSPEAWSGGARWFRCDVAEVANIEDNGATATRTANLRDALKAASPLALGCYSVKLARDSSIDTMPAADCDKQHNAEYAGVWTAPVSMAYPTKSADWDRLHNECRKVIAKFANVPADGNMQYRTGVVSLPGSELEWQTGNRGVRCYLWLSERNVNKSMKGAGPNGLPIRYAD